jgi:FtsZ-binding cell division protein ZapB
MISEKEIKELKNKEKILRQAAESINVQDKDLPRVIQRFLNEIKEFDEKIKTFKK